MFIHPRASHGAYWDAIHSGRAKNLWEAAAIGASAAGYMLPPTAVPNLSATTVLSSERDTISSFDELEQPDWAVIRRIAAHEAYHAIVAYSFGCKVVAIRFTRHGGYCKFSGHQQLSPFDRLTISAAGHAGTCQHELAMGRLVRRPYVHDKTSFEFDMADDIAEFGEEFVFAHWNSAIGAADGRVAYFGSNALNAVINASVYNCGLMHDDFEYIMLARSFES